MPKHSNSTGAYRFSASVSDLDPHWMSRSFSLDFSCTRANPRPCRFEASDSNMVSRSGSKNWRQHVRMSKSFVFSKAVSWSSVHRNSTPFFRRARSGSVTSAIFSTKPASWLAKPRKERSSVRLFGRGKSFSALVFSGSGVIPWGVSVYPANSIFCPISSFFFEIAMFCFLHLSRIVSILSSSVFRSGAHTRMSSTIFCVPGTFSIVLSLLAQKTSFVERNPIGPLL